MGRQQHVRNRIIPARAGFTSQWEYYDVNATDHPRSRGVYRTGRRRNHCREGSSPLARGLRKALSRSYTGRRIIPARAGFTGAPGTRAPGDTDHPRSRGVYAAWDGGVLALGGSSPLARGLRSFMMSSSSKRGIIPARAGFTTDICARKSSKKDHPRSRGVYHVQQHLWRSPVGSSPLARGLRIRIRIKEPVIRIIPARAGFTSSDTICWGSGKDHPRSRGVYRPGYEDGPSGLGSSPLARGLHRREGSAHGAGGIIPARAGFTRRTHPILPSGPDHPRSRGVYFGW